MSPRQPRITAAQVLRALARDGWWVDRQSGSHAHLRHPSKRARVTVPQHSGVILSPKTLRSICEQAGLTMDRLRELL